jgi:hypothetical protein
LRQYFPPDVLWSFHKLRPGAFKADLFRYCYLYIHGGVYADLDCKQLAPMLEITRDDIRDSDFIAVSERRGIPGIYQAFMACVPACRYLQRAIDLIVHNCKNEFYPHGRHDDRWTDILSLTGPVLLCRAFEGIHAPGHHTLDDTHIYLYQLDGETIADSITDRELILSKVPDYVGEDYAAMFMEKRVYNELRLE